MAVVSPATCYPSVVHCRTPTRETLARVSRAVPRHEKGGGSLIPVFHPSVSFLSKGGASLNHCILFWGRAARFEKS